MSGCWEKFLWVGAGGDMVWRRQRCGWWHSRLESLQVLLTFDLDLDCDNLLIFSWWMRQKFVEISLPSVSSSLNTLNWLFNIENQSSFVLHCFNQVEKSKNVTYLIIYINYGLLKIPLNSLFPSLTLPRSQSLISISPSSKLSWKFNKLYQILLNL